MNSIAIFGGAGFIGSRVTLALLEQGHNVKVVDIFDPQIHGLDLAHSETLKLILGKAPIVVGDIRNPSTVRQALDGVDTVIYLAAGTGTGQSMYQIKHYVDVNVGGAAQLAEELVARKDQIRRVVVSSSRAVYGEGAYLCGAHNRVTPTQRDVAQMQDGRFEPQCPICRGPLKFEASLETDAVAPTSVYGISKLAQEQLILNICGSIKIPAIALRYQNVYGPGQSLKNPYTGILSIFSQLLLQDKEINIFEDGLATRDFVFIDDIVHYTCAASASVLSENRILNVGTGERQSLLDVVNLLAVALKKQPRYKISGQFRLGDIRHASADIRELKRILGSRDMTTFQRGVTQFIAWASQQNKETDANERYAKSLREMADLGLLKGER